MFIWKSLEQQLEEEIAEDLMKKNTAEVHTIEHLGATFLRNHPEFKDRVLYFGPMGCRTGFSLLTSGLSHSDAIVLIKETVRFIADYDGKIPGTEPKECGNYREHDLAGAKKLCADYYEKIKDWTGDKLAYTK